ncbi:MAG TPA: ATP-binding protein [Bacillota bacterium]|nr:ATP-binding protein [Bacillota bacterium]HRX91865.1 ATP-binding protein [Candidatus Izemoplasmatales bacterium]
MKRKITSQSILVVSVALLAFVVGSIFLVRRNLNNVTEFNLRYYLEIVKTDYENDLTPAEIIEKYDNIEDYLRITFMDDTGIVLADSSATELENHLTRPEFQDPGTIYIRKSVTLDQQMMYLAFQFDDGDYVRVSVPINSILPFFNDFIGLLLLIAAIIAVLAYFLSKSLIDRTMAPFNDLKKVLQAVGEGKYNELLPVSKYDEINGLLVEINEINKTISDNIVSLNAEKQKSDFLLDHMNQGLCMLDYQENIVLVNSYLAHLFNYSSENHLYRNYNFLFRSQPLQQAVDRVYESKGSTTLVISVNDSYYSVGVAYEEKDWRNQPGVVMIFTDVTIIKNMETLKRDFFVNASHELKSPLTSIMGSSELITSGIIHNQDEIADLASRILDESKRMNKLVLDMLDLSKYENYIPLKAPSTIDLQAVICEVVDKLEPQAQAKNIKLINQSVPMTFSANQEHMEQLIRNLMENSIQYGKESGWVKIETNATDKEITIKVTDNGIGIPSTDQSRVFERFYRVDKARSKKSGGTGLGLSIVKHIVLIYQGRIELESKEGKGTEITIVLPEQI